jgi:sulfopyruvate decarboxylase subunit beta
MMGESMSVHAALKALAEVFQNDEIVITNQGSSRILPSIRQRELDLHYNPSTMGGAIPLGLGIAIARPDRHVLVVSGDGSLLMNLGCLVTTVSSGVQNFSIVLLDNGLYEVTGGQSTAGVDAGVDYVGIARACGFSTALDCHTLDCWKAIALQLSQQPGPRFVRLVVDRATAESLEYPTPPIATQLNLIKRSLI